MLLQYLRDSEFDLRLVELSKDVCLPATVADALPSLFDKSRKMKLQFQRYRDTLVAEKDLASKPTFIIAEAFLNWTEELAEELQIPRYLLFPNSGWLPLALLLTKLEKWTRAEDDIIALPGYPESLAKELPLELSPLCNIGGCAGVLIDTFKELEETGYDAVLKSCKQFAITFGINVPRPITCI